MPDQYPIELLVALFFASIFVYAYLDSMVRLEANPVVTGVIQGVPISAKYRRLLLHSRWVGSVAVTIAYLCTVAMGFALTGMDIDAEKPRLFAWMGAFLAALAAMSWILQAPGSYLHLRSMLRQTEAS
jgi:predicted secreted protein